MLDLAIAARALDQGAGKDVADKQLGEMSALASAGDYAAAAEKAAKCIEGGVTDIRVFGHFWLGVFLERGPEGISPMLSSAKSALDPHFDILCPEVRRDKVTDAALSLLFRTMVARIDFHEAARDATLKNWLSKSSPELAAAAREAAKELRTAIEKVVVKSRSVEQLSELENRIESVFGRAPAPSAPASAPSAPAPSAETPASTDESDVPDLGPPSAEEPEQPDDFADEIHPFSPGSSGTGERLAARSIEISPALDAFLKKIDAFEALIERGDMSRASVVAADIRDAIETFDPRVYLPKLLAPYFRLLALHIDDIASSWEAMGSPAWRALEQYYKVDPEAFVGDGDE